MASNGLAERRFANALLSKDSGYKIIVSQFAMTGIKNINLSKFNRLITLIDRLIFIILAIIIIGISDVGFTILQMVGGGWSGDS